MTILVHAFVHVGFILYTDSHNGLFILKEAPSITWRNIHMPEHMIETVASTTTLCI